VFCIDTFNLTFYLRKPIPTMYIKQITKILLSSHTLAVEEDRYRNGPRHERLCTLCNYNDMEDEYHAILICPS